LSSRRRYGRDRQGAPPRRLSQAKLARRMKTTQSTVARLESGRGQPSTRTLLRFAKATGHRLKISFRWVKTKE
jgi:transcriptional regulator with XRE-family HTH domain